MVRFLVGVLVGLVIACGVVAAVVCLWRLTRRPRRSLPLRNRNPRSPTSHPLPRQTSPRNRRESRGPAVRRVKIVAGEGYDFRPGSDPNQRSDPMAQADSKSNTSPHDDPLIAGAKRLPPRSLIDPAALPDAYGMVIAGDCLDPEVPDGAVCQFSTIDDYRPGDLAIFWLRRDLVGPGELQATVKRIVSLPHGRRPGRLPYHLHPEANAMPVFIAESLNPPQRAAFACDRLEAVHRFTQIIPAEVAR